MPNWWRLAPRCCDCLSWVDAARLPNLAPAPLSPALQRTPRCVGHDAELAHLRQCLAENGALLLLGEAGLGKSRLLAEAVAARSDVLAVKAQTGDAGGPYATLSRLLPELRSEAAPPAPPPEASRLLLQDAVQALLVGGGHTVIVVDDLHFADAASLEMLAALVSAEPLSGLAWLFAQRPGEGGDAARGFGDALIDSGRLLPIRLAPLDEAAVAQLLRSLGLPALDVPAWAPRLQRHTGGNPLCSSWKRSSSFKPVTWPPAACHARPRWARSSTGGSRP